MLHFPSSRLPLLTSFFFLFPTTEIITTTSHRLGTIEHRDRFLLLACVSSLSLFLCLSRADEYISRQKRIAAAFKDSASYVTRENIFMHLNIYFLSLFRDIIG